MNVPNTPRSHSAVFVLRVDDPLSFRMRRPNGGLPWTHTARPVQTLLQASPARSHALSKRAEHRPELEDPVATPIQQWASSGLGLSIGHRCQGDTLSSL